MSFVPSFLAPRRSRNAAILIAAAAILLGGCGSMRDALGLNKHAPDEFAVVTKAPLIIPPDYNLLPPKPTVEQPRETNPQAEAIQALFPEHKVAPPSQSEAMLIRKTGGDEASSDIRTKVGGETTEISNRGSDTAKILYDDTVSVPNQPPAPAIERREPVEVEDVR